MQTRNPRSILITGASSGIGEALALAYAAPGAALALTGRDGARLQAVASACRKAGAAILADTVDVADRSAMEAFIASADTAQPLDLVVANAGISAGLRNPAELDAHTRSIFEVNVTGVLNTLHPAITHMLPRGRGQLAIVSSIAGYRGLPGAAAYAASKAAVKSYGEGLRGLLARRGIAVSVVCPGYVRTRLTARNRFPMPFLMDADRAAGAIVRGLAANRGRVTFPWPMAFAGWAMAALPDRLIDALSRRLPVKE